MVYAEGFRIRSLYGVLDGIVPYKYFYITYMESIDA
jgi:hypothetical protein